MIVTSMAWIPSMRSDGEYKLPCGSGSGAAWREPWRRTAQAVDRLNGRGVYGKRISREARAAAVMGTRLRFSNSELLIERNFSNF